MRGCGGCGYVKESKHGMWEGMGGGWVGCVEENGSRGVEGWKEEERERGAGGGTSKGRRGALAQCVL